MIGVDPDSKRMSLATGAAERLRGREQLRLRTRTLDNLMFSRQ